MLARQESSFSPTECIMSAHTAILPFWVRHTAGKILDYPCLSFSLTQDSEREKVENEWWRGNTRQETRVIIKQPHSPLHMAPTVTEGMVDGKIIYSVWKGQGHASKFESAVHT